MTSPDPIVRSRRRRADRRARREADFEAEADRVLRISSTNVQAALVPETRRLTHWLSEIGGARPVLVVTGVVALVALLSVALSLLS